jgi:hypothetical protein
MAMRLMVVVVAVASLLAYEVRVSAQDAAFDVYWRARTTVGASPWRLAPPTAVVRNVELKACYHDETWSECDARAALLVLSERQTLRLVTWSSSIITVLINESDRPATLHVFSGRDFREHAQCSVDGASGPSAIDIRFCPGDRVAVSWSAGSDRRGHCGV